MPRGTSPSSAAWPPCKRPAAAASKVISASPVSARLGTMKLLPSVVLKLFLAAMLSALVTGESLERVRRGLAAATSNPDPPTGSTNQLLPTGGDRTQEVQDLEGKDLDLFKVTFSSKPQALATPSKEKNGKKKKKGKGLGKKRDPCLKKYKDYCIHGECRYVKDLRIPSCHCLPGYYGQRCHGLTLPVENPLYTYDHTTVLAVVAVVLSSVCLLVIVGLLMFRYHRRGGYDLESEEKVKLGIASSH